MSDTILTIPDSFESWERTNELRFLQSQKVSEDYPLVGARLQVMYRSSKGNVKWEDVPLVIEDVPSNG